MATGEADVCLPNCFVVAFLVASRNEYMKGVSPRVSGPHPLQDDLGTGHAGYVLQVSPICTQQHAKSDATQFPKA
jgi:hypothetical protein